MIDYNCNLLSFCIPTYNRCEILRECLADLILKIKGYNFPILISDNCSDDETEAVVKEFQANYKNIKYFRHEIKVDVDINFSYILSKSESQYTWLLGDSYRIHNDVLNELLAICNINRYPLILVNAFDMIKNIPKRTYNNLSELLNDLGWYLPLMSAYLYRRDFLLEANFKKFHYTNFLQMGIVFDYFQNQTFEFLWIPKNSIYSTNLKKQSWHNEVLKVFAKNWTEFILALPAEIPLDIKLKSIKEHGKHHGLFSLKNLLNYRQNGWLTFTKCKEFKIYFPFISIYPWIIVVLISTLPINVLTRARRIIYKQVES